VTAICLEKIAVLLLLTADMHNIKYLWDFNQKCLKSFYRERTCHTGVTWYFFDNMSVLTDGWWILPADRCSLTAWEKFGDD
jgi:hypothetical protein